MLNVMIVKDVSHFRMMIKDLSKQGLIACDLESSGLDTRIVKLEGIGLGYHDKQYFLSYPNIISRKIVYEGLKNIFNNNKVIFHNAKYDLKLLHYQNLPLPTHFEDTMLMAWLADENISHGLKALAKGVLGRNPKHWDGLKREIDLFTTADDITFELANYCGDDVRNTYDLYQYYLPILKKEGLFLDYKKIELPLVKVLIDMEIRGIKVDLDWLNKKHDLLNNYLYSLQILLRNLANSPSLDLRSSKQIGEILFDKFHYAPLKVTDSGARSVDDNVLKRVIKENDLDDKSFVSLLIKFRELDKLDTNYFLALAKDADRNHIIHSHFLQHRTRTGRLASNNPNLQNIPTRNDEWNVRKAFIARKNHRFIIADYSQIELRMLAHLSKDPTMVKAFIDGKDIHKTTMKLTGIKERKIAKNVNFGVIYGIGPRNLAHIINRKEDEAKHYINRFFDSYPTVYHFIRRVQNRTLQDGYVRMITGRRRRFNSIKDKRWFNMIKRQAINTLVQGSSADIMKILMIKLSKVLLPFKAYQLIQIHDEVIIETPIQFLDKVKKIVKETMEGIVKLRVPLKISMVDSDYWIKS